MQFIKTEIPDVFIIEPKVWGDSRGYFYESFKKELIKKEIGNVDFIQDNESKSSYGTLRGLHLQKPPFTQAKLVRVISGEVLDVIVDVRIDSPTFGKHLSISLSDQNKRQLFVPRGFAHGFVVLSEEAVFSYKVDNVYNIDSELGIIYNDSTLNINWIQKSEDIKLSPKDSSLTTFNNSIFYSKTEYFNK
jgi:dTDP-4-dehydrorhamnose 3,5-epimerase